METINILMLGGRRCGKTTVLSAMYQEIGKILAGTGLSLSVGNDQTRKELAQAAEIIQQNIRKFATPLTRIEIDDNPTSANRSYNFTLTACHKPTYVPENPLFYPRYSRRVAHRSPV